jgi:RNA polymerase sigma factor (sigma-70 family)
MIKLQKYLQLFGNLRTSKSHKHWGEDTLYQAPHKPLLLLSVVDLYADGELETNLIELSPVLESSFQHYWSIVMPLYEKGNIAMPFWHLQSEGFWHLLPRLNNTPSEFMQGQSTAFLRKSFLGAKLDDALYDLICAQEYRGALRNVLIRTYFAPYIQGKLLEEIAANAMFQKAVQYLRDGNRQDSRRLVTEVIRHDHRNARAWYLLSHLVENNEQRSDCLRQAVAFDTSHTKAREELVAFEAASLPARGKPAEQLLADSAQAAASDERATGNLSSQLSEPMIGVLIEKWLSELSFTERTVINHLYLNTYRFSITAVGRIISVSAEKAIKIHKQALIKLRQENTHKIIGPVISSLDSLLKSYESSITDFELSEKLRHKWVVEGIDPVGFVRLVMAVRGQSNVTKKGEANVQISTNDGTLPTMNTPSQKLQLYEGYEQTYLAGKNISLWKEDKSLLEVLGFSRRTFNALKRAKINTVGQLVAVYPEYVLAIKNIGSKSMEEIGEKLGCYIDKSPPVSSEPSSTEPALIATVQVDRNLSSTDHSPLLQDNTSIETLNLSRRTFNALFFRSRITTIRQLVALSLEKLLEITGIGQVALKEIENQLEAYSTEFVPFSQRNNDEITAQITLPLSSNHVTPIRQANNKQLTILDALSAALEPEMVKTFEAIPLDEISIARLGLSQVVESGLQRQGLNSVKQLIAAPQSTSSSSDIIARLRRYLLWLIKQDATVSRGETLNVGISPLLQMDLANTTVEHLFKDWLAELSDRAKEVIQLRYGLSSEILTLQEVGERYGVSRERIRQIEKTAIRTLQNRYKRWGEVLLRPFLIFLYQSFLDQGGLLSESELIALLKDETLVRLGNIDPLGAFLLICEVDERFAFYKRQQFAILSIYPADAVYRIQQSFKDILADKLTGVSESRLKEEFKQKPTYEEYEAMLSDNFFEACLRVHPEIEQLESGLYSLTRTSMKRLGAIVTAMREIGEPVHFSAITEKVNSLLPPDQHFTHRAIHAKLGQHPDIFVWVRLRGTYGLKEWGLEQGLSYVDALAQVLEDANRPLTLNQIMPRLPQYRQHFDESSILITLGTHEHFRTFPNNAYGLAEWTNQATQTDFGDLLGNQLAQWQADFDRYDSGAVEDVLSEVDSIRTIGLDFFTN